MLIYKNQLLKELENNSGKLIHHVKTNEVVHVVMVCILLPKLFWPTARKNCSSDREKLLKFEAESWEFAKFLRSLEQFIQTVKG